MQLSPRRQSGHVNCAEGIALTMLEADLLAHPLKASVFRPTEFDSEEVHLIFIVVVFPGLNPQG